MATLRNAAPKVIFGGINDQSRGQMVQEPETFAQHTPLLRLFAQTGPSKTTYVPGTMAEIFGPQTLNRRSKYFNLQSLLAEHLLAEGNGIFVKRLIPDDAPPPARLIVGIDIVADDIPKLVGRLDGFDYPNDGSSAGDVILDANGDPELVSGYRARLVLINDNRSHIGTQTVVDGSFVAHRAGGEQSKIYPLFELPASFIGEGGNLNGIRLWAPTTLDATPFDEATAKKFKTRMYRIQFMRRSSPEASAVSVRTKRDEEYVDICFTPGVYSESTDVEFYAPDVLIDHYQDDGLSGAAPMYSPFEMIHIYEDNLAQVQAMIYDAEMGINPAASVHVEAPAQIDVFTGVDIDGDRHMALLLEGPMLGGVRMGREHTVYAQGGGDGTMDLDMYEKLVNRENLNFGALGDEYENMNIYPFSVIYDTGLSMEGKYNMMQVLSKRPDIRTVFTTYVEADGKVPTRSEELSRTQALMSRLRGFPESVLYSTGVCRAEIIMQTGRLASGGYTKPVPQVIDYAANWARFAGAASGIMREGADIDADPNNRVTLINKLNVEYFNQRTQSDLWENGGTYSLSYDRRSQYYPAIQSVYSNDTSVLMSPITVAICTDVIRLVNRVHAHFSGNASLTKEQLKERCDRLITRMTNGRYNDRVVIQPDTYFTEADDKRGFSWHCRVTVYANNPRTVMFFDLETRRMEDL